MAVYSSFQIQERQRTPLGRLTAWCIDRTAGTLLQKPLITLVHGSWVGRLAAAITVNLIIGVLLDLAIHFVPVPHLVGVSAILGAIAGAAAQGAGGAVVGALWGWLVGIIVDAIASEYVSDPLTQWVGNLAAWVIAALLGWMAGRAATWLFERFLHGYHRIGQFLGKVAITICLASIAVILFETGTWVGMNYAISWTEILGCGLVLGRWILMIGLWIIAAALPLLWYMDWTTLPMLDRIIREAPQNSFTFPRLKPFVPKEPYVQKPFDNLCPGNVRAP